MTVNQNYALLNLALPEVLGESAITVHNVRDLADAGKLLENFENGYDLFNKAINDVMVKTVMDSMLFELTGIPFLSDASEYGGFIREIYIGMPKAKENTAWKVGDAGYTPQYMPVSKLPVSVKVYTNRGTHQFEYTLPDDLLKSAFHSEAELDAYFNGVGVAVENAVALNAQEISRLVRCNFIARKALAENGLTSVNLLTKFKEVNPSTTLDEDTAIYDKEFQRFCAEFLSRYPKKFGKPTALYNDEETVDGDPYIRQTTKEHLVFEIVDDFASKFKFGLNYDAFKDIALLPKYNEVEFWQGAGTGDDYADHTTIKVDVGTAQAPEEVTLTGVVAMAYDDRCFRMIYDNPKTVTERNSRDEYTNFITKANYGYAIKLSHNAVVFYIADEDWSFHKGITVDIADLDAELYGKAVSELNKSFDGFNSYWFSPYENPEAKTLETDIGGIYGGVPYVADYTGFSEDAEEQSGAYIALNITANYDNPDITVTYGADDKEYEVDEDGNVVIRVNSDDDRVLTIVETVGGKENIYTIQIGATIHDTSDTKAQAGVNTLTAVNLDELGVEFTSTTIADYYPDGITIAEGGITAELDSSMVLELEDGFYVPLFVKPITDVTGFYRDLNPYVKVGTEWVPVVANQGTLVSGDDSEECLAVFIPCNDDQTAITSTDIRFVTNDRCYAVEYTLTGLTISSGEVEG